MDIFSLLKAKRPVVIQIAAKHGAYDIRVRGSVVRGETVDPWFPAGLILELERELGRRVDVVTETGWKPHLREHVLWEAVPL